MIKNHSKKLIMLILFAFAMVSIYACAGCAWIADEEETHMEWITLENGLSYQIVQVGTGDVAKSGDTVIVHYTGTFEDGRVFDSSVQRNQPFNFPLGAGRVIRGWDIGVEGMHIGERRILRIPSDLAYGSRGAGGIIPPNTDLIFEVELLEIRR